MHVLTFMFEEVFLCNLLVRNSFLFYHLVLKYRKKNQKTANLAVFFFGLCYTETIFSTRKKRNADHGISFSSAGKIKRKETL